MKARSIVIAAALAALTVLSAGCKKHSFRATGPIRFAVSSTTPGTKSAYSGDIIGSKERIDWVEDDKLAIFMAWGSPETDIEGTEIRDYSVASISTDGVKSKATVTPVDEPLQWLEDEDKLYTFAALYPSPSVAPFEEGKWENKLELYNLTLTYPAVQTLTPKGATGADALTLLPDMKYAYMYAFPTDPVASTAGTVNLSLIPVFNAYEISISAGDNDEVNLTQFRLVSNREDEPLACVRNLYTDDSHGESTSITVDLTGIKLVRDGAPLVFTVFSYADSYQEITLEFTGNEIGTRKLDMKRDGEWISFNAMLKHKITGLFFPKLDEGGAEGQGINWNGTIGEDLNWNGAEGEDINWGGNKPYVLPGKFSISATKQVQFARGNLIYKAGKWDFHKQQYDRCFKENGVVELSETATFDLFGWATAGIAASDATMRNYQPWSFNATVIPGQEITNPYGFGPSVQNVGDKEPWDPVYCDWGNNYKLIECLGAGWFTMTAYEWEYIFHERAASTVNGVANARFAKAKVNGLPGLLIFPDTFGTDYAGAQSVFSAVNINSTSKYDSDYDFIDLPLKVWKDVEAAGAVFLAPTGAIIPEGGQPYVFVHEDESIYINVYWSSTCSYGYEDKDGDGNPDPDKISVGASVFGCEGPEVITSEDGSLERQMNSAVRLVKLAE